MHDKSFATIFSESVACCFIFIAVSKEQKLFILKKSIY